MTMVYPKELKEHLVARMLGAQRVNPYVLARETGIARQTLSAWSLAARRVASMTKQPNEPPTPPDKPPRRPQDWTAQERLRAVNEAFALTDADLGAWLRREGLHEATLTQWREAALRGLATGLAGARGAPGEAKRVKQLERELLRKDKALAEAAAILVMRGKMQALWGDEGGNTGRS